MGIMSALSSLMFSCIMNTCVANHIGLCRNRPASQQQESIENTPHTHTHKGVLIPLEGPTSR